MHRCYMDVQQQGKGRVVMSRADLVGAVADAVRSRLVLPIFRQDDDPYVAKGKSLMLVQMRRVGRAGRDAVPALHAPGHRVRVPSAPAWSPAACRCGQPRRVNLVISAAD